MAQGLKCCSAFTVQVLNVPQAPAGVELFFLSLDLHVSLAHPDFAVLSPCEREHAAQYVQQADALRYAAAHAALRIALSQRMAVPVEHIPLMRDHQGRPCLDVGTPKFDFNISHSGRYALIAIGHCRRVGVDIEVRKPGFHWWELADVVFSNQDAAYVSTLPETQRCDSFFDIWATKEAFLKAAGCGLVGNMTGFAVQCEQDGYLRPLCVGLDNITQSLARFEAVISPAPEGYSACLAWERQ